MYKKLTLNQLQMSDLKCVGSAVSLSIQISKIWSLKEMKESTGKMNIQTIDILAVNTTETNVNAKLIVGNDDDDIDMIRILTDTF